MTSRACAAVVDIVRLRSCAAGCAIPVTKAHPKVSGTSVAIGMGEILYNDKVAEALGPNVTLHFQALYSDPRGTNLFSEFAHECSMQISFIGTRGI
jgi:hypothetical protein